MADMKDLLKTNMLAGIMLGHQSQALWRSFVKILSDPELPLTDHDLDSILNNVGIEFSYSHGNKYGDHIVNHVSDDPSVADPKHAPTNSNVHPNYYADQGKGHHDLAYHEDQMFPKPWIEGNCVITAIKYLKRFKSKNGVEDIKKARTYLDRLIKLESEK